MRLLSRNLVDAFPELARYDLATRKRFIALAAGSPQRRFVRLACSLALASVFAAFVVIILLSGVFVVMTHVPSGRPRVETFEWGVAAIAVFVCCTPLFAIYIRDLFLRSNVRDILSFSNQCKSCGYSLQGLPFGAADTIICPECAFTSPIHPAFRILTAEPMSTP